MKTRTRVDNRHALISKGAEGWLAFYRCGHGRLGCQRLLGRVGGLHGCNDALGQRQNCIKLG